MNHANIPSNIVPVWRANSRRVISVRMATPPRLARVRRISPSGGEGMRTVTSHPDPARSGVGTSIFFCMATAHSNVIRVPKNPEIIKGPCASARDGVNAGSCHRRRIRPAHSAARRPRMARKRNGSGKRLGSMSAFYRNGRLVRGNKRTTPCTQKGGL